MKAAAGASYAATSAVHLEARRLDDFCDRLAAHLRVRVDRPALWAIYDAAFPERPIGDGERHWLVAALDEAARRGIVRLPSRGGTRWDRTREPPVPTSVDRTATAVPGRTLPPTVWRGFPWHPALAWVPDLPYLTDEEHAVLRCVHDRLTGDGFAVPVPIKYRSLELTGDEKRLERLADGRRLFGPGRLTLPMLGCVPDQLPIAWEAVGPGEAALVVENHALFGVARAVLRAVAADRGAARATPYGILAFGSGKSVSRSIAWLAQVEHPIRAIHYVGDLDWPGLQAAAGAVEAACAAGLPSVIPAPGIHAAMLAAARRFGAPDGWAYEFEDVPGSGAALLEWLPVDVQAQVRRVLRMGRRVPEEVLGPAELCEVWGASGARPRGTDPRLEPPRTGPE